MSRDDVSHDAQWVSVELPNGMRLRQWVRIYSKSGRRSGDVLTSGEVIAYYDRPTVVVRRADGSRAHLAADLDWDDLSDPDVAVTGADRARAALIQVRGRGRTEEEK